MSSQVHPVAEVPDDLHLANLEKLSEYNRQRNWDLAAQMERKERGNLFWWTNNRIMATPRGGE